MIEIRYIANCYIFHCPSKKDNSHSLDEYLLYHNYKSLVIDRTYDNDSLSTVIIFDTYLRDAYNCFYDLCASDLRRLDSDTVLRFLDAFNINIDNAGFITHINIDDFKKVYQNIEKGD